MTDDYVERLRGYRNFLELRKDHATSHEAEGETVERTIDFLIEDFDRTFPEVKSQPDRKTHGGSRRLA